MRNCFLLYNGSVFTKLWDMIKDKAVIVWKWLIDDLEKSFFSTRLFYALLILAALVILIVFIISKRKANEKKRIITAAIDRLRDEALANALKNSDNEEPVNTDRITEAFLLKRFPQKKTYTVLQIREISELSKKEHIIPIDDDNGITIGRSDKCSISMRDRYVAEKHCQIRKNKRKLFIIINQDEQLTFLRGTFKIYTLEPDREYRLRKGARIQIGISTFEINSYRFRITGGYL